jgi:hypothetical protein
MERNETGIRAASARGGLLTFGVGVRHARYGIIMSMDYLERWERFIAGLRGKFPDARIAQTFGLTLERVVEIGKKYQAVNPPKYRKGEAASKRRSIEIDFDKTHFTVDEVASILSTSRDTVIRRFANEPGVVVDGNTETTRERRRYRQLRIPKAVLNRVLARKTVKK